MTTHRTAFTLIELSIVLVIIGLVVGGVLVGKDLVDHARLRTIQTQVDQVTAAVHTFKLKYNCLPGDCTNATQFFTASADCNPNHTTTYQHSPMEICNGDGNGQVGEGPGGYAGTQFEPFFMWRTLQAAGLFDAGITISSASCVVTGCYMSPTPGGNVPKTKYSNDSFFYVANNYLAGLGAPAWGNSAWFPLDYTNSLVFGNNWMATANGPLNSVQAQSLDSKYDDGYGNTGKMVSWYAYSSCVPAISATPTLYAAPNSANLCGLVYLRLF